MKKLALAFLSLFAVGQMALALPVSAQDVNQDPLKLLEATNLGNGQGAAAAGTQLPILVGRIIRVALSLLGIIFLILMVYAGFKWMTARGESEPIDEARDTIKAAVIGLLIIFVAYALTGFIINAIIKATSGTP